MDSQVFFSFPVLPEHSSLRLDALLALLYPQFSRAQWQSQISSGFVTVDGKILKASSHLITDQTIIAFPPVPQPTSLTPAPNIPLTIIFQDEHIAVVDKPAGLVTHPGAGNPENTLVHALLARLETLASAGGELRPGIVHRLDKDTSGLMVVARTDLAYHNLRSQFSIHSVLRGYLFLCWGELPDAGTIDSPISRHPRFRKRMAVVPWGMPAITRYRAIASAGEISLGMARLGTGRTHQVRVHLSSIGHPLVGDERYGGKTLVSLKRQALHSSLLGFTHPLSGEAMRFLLPLPDDMQKAWRGVTGGSNPPAPNWEPLF